MTNKTDTTDDAADEQPDGDWTEGAGDDDGDSGDDGTRDDAGGGMLAIDKDADVRTYLLKGALVLLAVLGVIATVQFYLSTQTAIRRFASPEFRPVFVAAFNLVVLLAVGVGIAQVARHLE